MKFNENQIGQKAIPPMCDISYLLNTVANAPEGHTSMGPNDHARADTFSFIYQTPASKTSGLIQSNELQFRHADVKTGATVIPQLLKTEISPFLSDEDRKNGLPKITQTLWTIYDDQYYQNLTARFESPDFSDPISVQLVSAIRPDDVLASKFIARITSPLPPSYLGTQGKNFLLDLTTNGIVLTTGIGRSIQLQEKDLNRIGLGRDTRLEVTDDKAVATIHIAGLPPYQMVYHVPIVGNYVDRMFPIKQVNNLKFVTNSRIEPIPQQH